MQLAPTAQLAPAMSAEENAILDAIDRLMIASCPSQNFVTELQLVTYQIRCQQLTTIRDINALPTEILLMIFDTIPDWKPLVRYTCYRWYQILRKYKLNKQHVLRYKSESILDWLFGHCDKHRFARESLDQHIYRGNDHYVAWLMKNTTLGMISLHSRRCSLFNIAISSGCILSAKYLYKTAGSQRIKISSSHFTKARTLKVFQWLDEITDYKYRGMQIIVLESGSDLGLVRYALEHKLIATRN